MDGCSFRVELLEVTAGDPLTWWGSRSTSAKDIRVGFRVSNTIVSGEHMGTTMDVQFIPGVLWDQFLVLSLYDEKNDRVAGSLPLQEHPMIEQPTMFHHCLQLSPELRVRWTLPPDGLSVEFGLETSISSTYTMNFGPASPNASNRLMGGADAAVVGHSPSTNEPFALDYYMSSYIECYPSQASQHPGAVEGVCEDAVYADAAQASNVELLYAHQLEGVSLIRFRRPLVSPDLVYDHPITPEEAQNYIWAVSPYLMDESKDYKFPLRVGPAILYHGPRTGEVFDLVLTNTTSNCAHFQGLITAAEDPSSDQSAYATSVELYGGTVTVSWRVVGAQIAFQVKSNRPCRWLSMAIGTQMNNGHAYVAWADQDSNLKLQSYSMTGQAPSDVKLINSEAMSEVGVELGSDGRMSFSFTRQLDGSCVEAGASCSVPSIDTGRMVPFIWAIGDSWRDGPLQVSDTHSDRSALAVYINLANGRSSTAAVDRRLVSHGWLMYLAWGAMIPFSIMAARFLKHYPNTLWLKVHQGMACAALVTMCIGLAVAIAEEWKDERHLRSTHSKMGVATLVLAAVNPINAYFRPPKKDDDDSTLPRVSKLELLLRNVRRLWRERRLQWEIGHRVVAIVGMILAIITLFSGLDSLERHGLRSKQEYEVALGVWFAGLMCVIVVLEQHQRYQIKRLQPLEELPIMTASEAARSSNGNVAKRG